ncbi:MAG: CRISPR-associated helicase Cas3 [Elusimicrobia bacterium]|nr:MAG: CRISPR-associated helicase Cas3 [Elusimicrobiota bacterium]KAF0157104.1 MAG: CRISPR-associated helicase Cas3 [Elusimicrobiota bacterium]
MNKEEPFYAHTKSAPDGTPAPKSDWQPLDAGLSNLWAKIDRASGAWHPLLLHMLDVAAVADAVLKREPSVTRGNIAAAFGLNWNEARPWILLAVACHDLGKACPGFQSKWFGAAGTGLPMPRVPDRDINHGFVSQIALSDWLQREQNWPSGLAELVGDAVGCHHGERATPFLIERLSGNRRAIGDDNWTRGRNALISAALDVFGASTARPPLTKQTLSGPEFMLLAGLASFSDWIGSDESHFCFGKADDCGDLPAWFAKRSAAAEQALDKIGWLPRAPLSAVSKTFEQALNFKPRPLQKAAAQAVEKLNEPAIILIEAPMGEGKTEAAFYAHLELQRRFGHRGLYIAMPTKATGNAMFTRALEFLRRQAPGRSLDLQLLHGSAAQNETFQGLRPSLNGEPGAEGGVRAAEWFTAKKKALLSEYGIGTVDQALLPILPVRHNFMRLWGLANRVVIFDEIHAYDAYTETLLVHLLRWLTALGSSVVLLSATLPPSIRRKLAGVTGADLPEEEAEYPRLSVFSKGKVLQTHFKPSLELRRTIAVNEIPEALGAAYAALTGHLSNGGLGVALFNTVQRAQDMYRLFPAGTPIKRGSSRVGKSLPDGTEVYLFHARFPSAWRQKREEQALELFGKDSRRQGRKILIATQVAEQSLDLDFDLMVTDLAPIDLILQRAGRLWRHRRAARSVAGPALFVAGLAGKEPPSFDKPLWWGAVYREDILLRTWLLLKGRKTISLPDDIDSFVRTVYESEAEIPDFLRIRMEKADEQYGKILAEQQQANQAIIGFPEDASWNQPARFVLHDEDDPAVHRTLMANTRLGNNSILTIPLFPADAYTLAALPREMESEWFSRAVSLSRKGVVAKLQSAGVPESWKSSPLLRNCFPLQLGEGGRWILDNSVRLDEDLGVVYEAKETA